MGVAILCPLLLIVLLAVMLYIPPIQNWAVHKAAQYASAETGMTITIDRVRLVFPLDLGMEGVLALQPNDSIKGKTDTIADIKRVVADVRLWPLLRGEVDIDELSLHDMRLNTANLVHEARIQGEIGLLLLRSHGIDLGASMVNIDEAAVNSSRLNVELSDTVPPDTTESTNVWCIKLDRLSMNNTSVTLHMPNDTLQMMAHFGKAAVSDGWFDLGKGIYQVGRVEWSNGQAYYRNNFAPSVDGFDYNHIALSNLALRVDSIYYCDGNVRANVRSCRFRERCGLQLTDLRLPLSMDSATLSIPSVLLKTTASTLSGQVAMDLNAFDDQEPGKVNVSIHGSIGKADIQHIAPGIPYGFGKHWPNQPLTIDGTLKGNMQKAHLSGVTIALPTAFTVKADGFVANLTDTDRLKADINVEAKTGKLGFIMAMFAPDMAKTVTIPNGMTLKSRIGIDGQSYTASIDAHEGKGSLRGNAKLDARRMAYSAQLTANGLQLRHFLPKMDIQPLTASIDVKGVGTDLFSPSTQMAAKARVTSFGYGKQQIDRLNASLSLANGKINVAADGDNPLFGGSLSFNGLTRSNRIKGTFVCDLSRADLRRLGITQGGLTVGMCSHIDIDTDLKNYYKVQGEVGDVSLVTNGKTYRPEDLSLDLLATADTTHAVVNCGDFHLDADASGSYETLMAQANRLIDEVGRQMHDKYIDQVRLRERLPMARIYLCSGKENVFCRLLKWKGYEVGRLLLDMDSSPSLGLNGELQIDSLVVDSILLDTIRFAIQTDTTRMKYTAQVRNNKQNPDYTFNALINGGLYEHGSYLTTKVYDANDELGLRLGLAAYMRDNGISLHIYGEDPILGYKKFAANKKNFVFLGDDQRISADLKLTADDGMGVQIYSNDENTDALQDITVSLAKFDLAKVLSVIPYTPDMGGMMNGDFHVVKTADELTVSSAVDVNDLVYEKWPMGDIGTEFVYMPMDDGSHYVDGMLLHDGNEVATLKGTYKNTADGYLDAALGLERLPMHLFNGFVPDHLIGLRGYGEGTLTVQGPLSKPNINGEVYLDSTFMYSEPYGVQLRFADDPVKITDSKLLFENFEMFANNDSPLNISGDFDFSNLDRMMLNIRMRARNFKLIDAKENARSEAYGKAFVNFFGSMTGPVESLRMRGKLDVLGTTDMTYVMRDAELTTDNELNELVTFTNFRDSTQEVVERPAINGFDMELSLSIDESAHIMCMLNADHSNYIDLMGGGDLRMKYNPNDNLTLTGRYTLNNGEMKYSLPIIPLKTFTIQDGSYLEFQGDPMNPTLNITATESVKATVNEGTGSGRSVEFDCGVKLTQTLNNLGLEFIIDAPNDMTISDELKTMTTEGRSKVAITMLASGMYLTDGNTSSFSMNSALSSFLQTEINNVAGKAMRSMGLDLGMSVDNSTTSSGAMHTDYNFKFSKRLWNNRLSVNIGGKVSTGAELDMDRQNNNTFFDNVELEYRLDENSSKYLRLFYDNNKYDWLEGPLGQYGVGFMWKRKLRHFKDIFSFGKKEETVPPAPRDSINTQKKDEK